MRAIKHEQLTSDYDPRWFIWTIVFLIVSGVSLASYIIITSTNDANNSIELSTTFLRFRNTNNK